MTMNRGGECAAQIDGAVVIVVVDVVYIVPDFMYCHVDRDASLSVHIEAT